VAGAEPAGLLALDGTDRESPGFAFIDNNRLLVGRDAAVRARLDPRRASNLFWDQINTESLEEWDPFAQNHAELAYAHLARIWEQVKGYGNEMILAVPDYFSREQLGLILGIAQELSLPVKGFVSLAVAASDAQGPEGLLLHLDIHLHRAVLTVLEQDHNLTRKASQTIPGKGLAHLYTEWVQAIAEEFVRTTRFDPLHQAGSEQELYNRLPEILAEIKQRPSIVFDMTAGSKTHRLILPRDLLVQKNEALFREIHSVVEQLRDQYARPGRPVTLQLAHRFTRLSGWQEMADGMANAHTIKLSPGAGALGVLRLRDQIAAQSAGQNVSYLTSRPGRTLRSPPQMHDQSALLQTEDVRPPTHLLHRNLAYPISDRPLIIGCDGSPDDVDVRIRDRAADISRRHCTLKRRGKDVLLEDHSTHGTFVDNMRVSGTVVLRLGQIIRVGTSAEKIQLIACVEKYET
jgi:hypothetical protein